MAKSDYICRICKQVKGSGFLRSGSKYQCPKHKAICGDHVTGWLSRTCTVCSSKVIRYEFNNKTGRWSKA